MGGKPRLSRWLLLAAAIVVLDQATKLWITSALRYHEVVPVTSFFDIVLVLNAGAAFSFLSDASGWQRWFFIVLALAISAWLVVLLRRHAAETRMPVAVSMILGGAIGNVIDRISVGAVIDFLYFHVGAYGWPAFNVADSAISLGVVLLVWDQMRADAAPAGEIR